MAADLWRCASICWVGVIVHHFDKHSCLRAVRQVMGRDKSEIINHTSCNSYSISARPHFMVLTITQISQNSTLMYRFPHNSCNTDTVYNFALVVVAQSEYNTRQIVDRLDVKLLCSSAQCRLVKSVYDWCAVASCPDWGSHNKTCDVDMPSIVSSIPPTSKWGTAELAKEFKRTEPVDVVWHRNASLKRPQRKHNHETFYTQPAPIVFNSAHV